VTANGAAVTVSGGGPSGSGRSYNQLGVGGAAGVTSIGLVQRIESYVSAQLPGSTALTFQIKIYNNTGATLTPQIMVSHAASQDSGGYNTVDLAATNLQPVPAAIWTQCAYTFTLPRASLQNGVQLQIIFTGAPLAGQQIYFAEADFRATPGLPVGLTAAASIPPAELRPIHEELIFCQRYFWDAANGGSTAWLQITVGYSNAAGTITGPMLKLPVRMRAPPIITIRNTTYTNSSGLGLSNTYSQDYLLSYLTASAAGQAAVLFNMTASAEL
jgi:hypothetical protein